MDEKVYQIVGLSGFIIAGIIFIVIGIRGEDLLTVIGSLVWILSCMVWMIPLVKSK